MSFTGLNLHKKILEKLESLGFSSPTPIQSQAIPQILEGHDLIASADTGTGKTAAFLLPVIDKIAQNPAKVQGPRVLILAPTRELATQIHKESCRFSDYIENFKSVVIFGGAPYSEQVKKVQSRHEILVATPGRLIDLMEKKKVDITNVELLIIDEADRMLDMGFVEPVTEIANSISSERQTLMFSATLSGKVLKLCEALLKNPVRVEVEKVQAEKANIEEFFCFANDWAHKCQLLTEMLEKQEHDQMIIFTSTKRAADELAEKLNDDGYDALALHGDMKQRQRDRTIRYLKSGKVRLLVATDVAARGIDISGISHVINFDLPQQVEDYIHRIGRTGRAGAQGQAHSFVSKRDQKIVEEIEKMTNKTYNLFHKKQRTAKEGSSDRPFKKERFSREKSFDKPFKKERFSKERSFDRPFKKEGFSSENSFDKPFKKEGFSKERSFDKPFKKEGFSRERSFDKPFGREGFSKERSFDKPFKKEGFSKERSFDKPFGRSRFKSSKGSGFDLEFPSKKPQQSLRGPKRGKKVFTSPKKGRRFS